MELRELIALATYLKKYYQSHNNDKMAWDLGWKISEEINKKLGE